MSLLSPTVPHATRYQFTDPSPAYWVPIIFKWVPQIGEARVNPKKKKLYAITSLSLFIHNTQYAFSF